MLLSVETAAADGPPRVAIGLQYHRDKGTRRCPDEALFRRLLLGAFGYEPVEDNIDDPLLIVSLTREGENVRADMSFQSNGSVVWESTRKAALFECQDFVDGLAVATKIRLDMQLPKPSPEKPAESERPKPANAKPLPAAPPPPAAPAPPTPIAPPPTLAPVPAPLGSEPWRPAFRLGAGSFLALGRTPANPSPGLLVSGELGGPFFSVALDMRALLPVVPYDLGGLGRGTTLHFSAFSASVGPCAKIPPFFGCLPFEIGVRDFGSSTGATTDVNNPVISSFGARLGAEIGFQKRYFVKGYVDATGMITYGLLKLDEQSLWHESRLTWVMSLAFAMSLGGSN